MDKGYIFWISENYMLSTFLYVVPTNR